MRRALWALLYALNAGMFPLAHSQRALPLGLDVEVNQVHTCTQVYTGLHWATHKSEDQDPAHTDV